MKTPDEIKKGLETCIGKCTGNKPHCPYHKCGDGCMDSMNRDAIAYIQQLENDLQYTTDAANIEVLKLESRLAQVERKKDAAVRIVHGLCLHCKNEDSKDDTCRECLYYPYRFVYSTGDAYVDNWQWRGVCEENTKEEK